MTRNAFPMGLGDVEGLTKREYFAGLMLVALAEREKLTMDESVDLAIAYAEKLVIALGKDS